MNKRRIAWIVGPILILAVLAALLLEQALPYGIFYFKTIFQQNSYMGSYKNVYEQDKPAIMIITSREEADDQELGVQFPPDVLQRLEHIDYRRYFVVCVFQGLRGSSGHGVGIQYLLRQGDTIIVQAKFIHPFNQLITPGTTFPYHLVRVPKGQLSGMYRFILRSETGETAEATHTIP